MPARSSHWSSLLTPRTQEAFFAGFSDSGRRASQIPGLFDVRSSNLSAEVHQGVGVLGSDGWNFDDSGRVQYDEPQLGYSKTFTHAQFAKGFTVERKLKDDNLFPQVLDQATNLGDSAFRKIEKSAASVFANAFTSTTNNDGFSTLGPDAVVLCSASHPLNAESSSVQSNTGTSALTAANVSTTRIAMQKFTDDRGDLMNVMPDEILIPPDLEDTALTIAKSLQDPVSANNTHNPQSGGRWKFIVWHYLTDTNNWFMMDSSRRRKSLLWYNRIPLEFGLEEDFDTFTAKYRAYTRFSYGWRDPLWIYGHNVT